jgi:hypothetical protein
MEASLVSSKYDRAESYAFQDPQRLFRYTDVEACFKYRNRQSIIILDKNA